MWTHSGYQLSQIARVKPTHSLTSVPLPYSVRSLKPIFLVPKPLSYRFFPLSVVPLSRTPVTGRTLSRWLFLRLNSTILSFSISLFISCFPSATFLDSHPLEPSSSLLRCRQTSLIPRHELPPDFWLLLSPASCSVTKSIRCFVEFSRPPLLLLDVGQVVVVFGG